jgi:predicted glycogen debranching enzyme
MKKDESIIFSASTFESSPALLKKQVDKELSGRFRRNNFENCLLNSAEQFIVTIHNKKSIKAGLPWYETKARDTFISLPGLTFLRNDNESFHEICHNMIAGMNGPLFADSFEGKNSYVSADAPLWFIWAVQKYCEKTNGYSGIWKLYGKTIKKIINGIKAGIPELNISLNGNGLIWQGNEFTSYTWMNAKISGAPVTPRYGYNVEINALWYNALMFAIDMAKIDGDKSFFKKWKPYQRIISESFNETFLHEKHGYLIDFVNDKEASSLFRPNQILATSLFYTPIEDEKVRKRIIDRIERELLTPKGLRSLSPNSEEYKGAYLGDHNTRESAMHQGSVFPWLMAHFAEGYLRIYGKAGLSFIRKLYHNFEEEMIEHGIGTLSEIYDGDPPHKAGGAPSMAISVAEIIRMKQVIDDYDY